MFDESELPADCSEVRAIKRVAIPAVLDQNVQSSGNLMRQLWSIPGLHITSELCSGYLLKWVFSGQNLVADDSEAIDV